MDEVSRSGRTVMFVSHNLGSLAQICNKGLLLNHGKMVSFGGIRETIDEYLRLSDQENHFKLEKTSDETDMQIVEVAVTDAAGTPKSQLLHNSEFSVSLRVNVKKFRRGATFCIALLNKYKRRVFTEHKNIHDLLDGRTGSYRLTFEIPGDFVAPNNYSFQVQIFSTDGEIVQELFDICRFEIIDAGSDMSAYRDYGYVLVKGDWKVYRDQ